MLHARVSSLPSVDMMNQADSIWKNWRSEEVANRLDTIPFNQHPQPRTDFSTHTGLHILGFY